MLKKLSPQEAATYRELNENQASQAIAYTLIPDGNGFEDVVYYGDSLRDVIGSNKKPEWVYVLANKHMPGILKIGFTTLSVYQRVNQLNASTSMVSPWIAVYTYKTCNGYALEQDVHNYLQKLGLRINPAREGFDIEVDTAISIIDKLGEKYKFI